MLRFLFASAVIGACSIVCISASSADTLPVYDVDKFCDAAQAVAARTNHLDDPQGLRMRNWCIEKQQFSHDNAQYGWDQISENAQRFCINFVDSQTAAFSHGDHIGVWQYEMLASCVANSIRNKQIEQDKREKRSFHY